MELLWKDFSVEFTFVVFVQYYLVKPLQCFWDCSICLTNAEKVIVLVCSRGLAQVNKYLLLKSVTENNGWSVDLFAEEVGARGYCSSLVLCCFKSLGLVNRTINTTIKQISKCSMECSSGWPETIRHGPLKKLAFFKNPRRSTTCLPKSIVNPFQSQFFENKLTSSSWLYKKREHLLWKFHPADTECLTVALE